MEGEHELEIPHFYPYHWLVALASHLAFDKACAYLWLHFLCCELQGIACLYVQYVGTWYVYTLNIHYAPTILRSRVGRLPPALRQSVETLWIQAFVLVSVASIFFLIFTVMSINSKIFLIAIIQVVDIFVSDN